VGSTGATPPVFATLNPGNYCGGISVTGKANVTLNAGTYLITGGGVTFNSAGNINGTGVTFYVSAGGGGVSINPTHSGALTADLVAPTTGAFAGILFYQDRGNASNATIDGNGGSKLQGALYFPDAALNLNDVSATAAYTIAVAESLSLTATTFNVNYTSLPGGSPVKTAVLVE
jgi:hypothetical protein